MKYKLKNLNQNVRHVLRYVLRSHMLIDNVICLIDFLESSIHRDSTAQATYKLVSTLRTFASLMLEKAILTEHFIIKIQVFLVTFL